MKAATLRLVAILCLPLLTLSWSLPSRADDIEWVDAGMSFAQPQADQRCPLACGSRKWDGNWKTVDRPAKSLCACVGKASPQVAIRPSQPGSSALPTSSPGYTGALRRA